MNLLLSIGILSLVLLLVVIAFLYYIITVNKEYKKVHKEKRFISSKQARVQENIQSYCCENMGESLNECEIYSMPYDATGC